MHSFRVPVRRRWSALLAIGAVTIAMVAGVLAWRGAPSTPSGPVAGVPSPSAFPWPSRSSAPLSSTEPPASSEPAASLNPPTVTASAAANLTATEASGPVVSPTTGFLLSSVDGSDPADLAKRLTVEPKLDLSIVRDADGGTIRLTPREPLIPGAVYRFSLTGPTGEQLDSWAFQASQPVRVVGTLPNNQSTDVPLDSGIEITFDQDGVTDAASFVTIEPPIKGQFEEHGRVLAFVPESLLPTTIYTVTVRAGVTVGATGESLAEDVRFRFETAAPGKLEPTQPTFGFQGQLLESPVGSAPEIGLWVFAGENVAADVAHIDVYRLPTLESAIDAFGELRGADTWSRWSAEGLVDTSVLPKVVSIDAKLLDYRGSSWFRLPEPLAAGWYVLQEPTGTRPAQAILQVTDIAGYLAVSETRTLVWANDLATKRPLAGASVSTGGANLGRTDRDGLWSADTPGSLHAQAGAACREGCHPVVIVRDGAGRSTFLPSIGQGGGFEYFGDSYWGGDQADARYWVLFHTDRTTYRPGDTINAWGVVRDRDSGDVPDSVGLRVDSWSSDDRLRPPIARVNLELSPTGVFAASIPSTDVPEGSYSVDLVVNGEVVRTRGFEISPIAKPAYRLEVETGRRTYVVGDRIRITARASFYEGTPVPGVPLQIDGSIDVKADASGTAIYRTVAKGEDDYRGAQYLSVRVSPARAEEAEIAAASNDFVVFPSRRTIDADARIASGGVLVKGRVHVLDVDRVEREIQDGGSVWDFDPRGASVSGASVTARFTELIPTKTRTGTEYDFIEKKTVPVYRYDTVERDAGTRRVSTDGSGRYSVSLPDSGEGHDYRVEVTVRDADGLAVESSAHAINPVRLFEGSGEGSSGGFQQGWLSLTDDLSTDNDGFGIGDQIDLTMHEGDSAAPPGVRRYLFFVAQRGIRSATVQTSARFVTTFESWAAPNIDIGAVRFTGAGYVRGGSYWAGFRSADRSLDVDLSIASKRYAPRDQVVVDVATRTATGAPVAATVVLRATDEKLFSIGIAEEADPLRELYAYVGSGILGTYRSHRPPRGANSGADTTGGGGDERSDFRDSLLFRAIETGADGRGTVSFKLSDDLTSWRVSASAITVDLEAGAGSVQIPVGLPFFVDASVAPEYLSADRPTIAVRTYGSALAVDAPVQISVTSKSLKFTSVPIDANAFATIAVPLPKLTEGSHSLTISATTGSGAARRTDRLTRSFKVVESRLTRSRTAYLDLSSGGSLAGGEGLTTVLVSDASAGQHVPLLVDLASAGSARLDRAIAAERASAILAERFGSARQDVSGALDAGPYQTQDGGLALLPYSSSDLQLSALIGIVAPDSIDRPSLEAYLQNRRSPGETRERRMVALAGLAGLGTPVLREVQAAAADPELTIRERLMIGLGAAALGDAATARSIAASLAAGYGDVLGREARLSVGSSSIDVTAATALMAVLAASIGEPNAAAYWRYVEANPSTDDPHSLEALGYASWTLDRLPAAATSFAYSIGGVRTVVDLAAGEALEVTLTAAQRAHLALEQLSGATGVTTTWRELVGAANLMRDPDVSISRSVTPIGAIDSDDLVQIDLIVSFRATAATGCHQVTDLLPSGMVPLGSTSGWVDPETVEPSKSAGIVLPYGQAGQRVYFCAERPAGAGSANLRYFARVVTPGSYVWEPAMVDSRTAPNRAALTPEMRIEVR